VSDSSKQVILSRRAKLLAAALATVGLGALPDGGVDGGAEMSLAPSFRVPVADSVPSPVARSWSKEGYTHWVNGYFVEALECYRKAYDVAPRAKILRRIAELYEKLGNLLAARAAYDALLATDDEAIQGLSREEIAAFREKVSARLGRIHVEAAPPPDGTQVLVDDRPVGTLPVQQTVLVNPGQHSIEIRNGESRKT
jgi:tetratricopeptide (TPR) repeat protein